MLKEIYEVYQLKLLETLKGSNNNASIAAAGGGSTFQVVENHPQSATKSNPFTMLQN